MIGSALFSLTAVLIALFVFWRRLKDDYDSKEIFSAFGFVLACGLVGLAVSSLWTHSFAFLLWASLGFLGLVLGVRRHEMRFYESFEAYILAILYFLAVVGFGEFVLAPGLASLYKVFAVWVIVALYHVLDANYHNFAWYASGKAGFAGLTTAGVGLLARVVAVLGMPAGFIAASKPEALVDGTLSFAFFLLVFNLSRSGK